MFNRREKGVVEFFEKAVGLVGEYEQAERKELALRVGQLLLLGFYKLNSDAAMIGDSLMGLGAIAHDHTSDVMMSTCWKAEA